MRGKLAVLDRERCIGCMSCAFACSRAWGKAVGVERSALRVKAYAGVEGVFSVRICRGCEDPDCARSCPTGALRPSGRGFGVELSEELCIRCGACVKGCAASALQWDEERGLPVPCRHCGVCCSFCPTGVLGMRG